MAAIEDTARWSELFASRTRAGVGGGLLEILALVGNTELIPFAGGFPDPQTFPSRLAAAYLDELAGDAEAFQYAPTRGLPGRSTRSPPGSRRTRAGGRRTTS